MHMIRTIGMICLPLILAGCMGTSDDPLASLNRQSHALNKTLDRNLVRPVARGYDVVVPDPVEKSISNFSGNLGLPGQMVNNVLQGDVESTVHNGFRLILNTTVGIGGLFDPANAIGLEPRDTDFGITLARWGVGEGPYVEVPVLGPRTTRHAVGNVVDAVLDPLGARATPQQNQVMLSARAAERLQQRHQLGDQVDDVLHNSADSYEQLRLIYLQNRRHEVSQTTGTIQEDAYIDPYADF